MSNRTSTHSSLTVRRSMPEDARALLRLAALDDMALPGGPFLVADVDGEIVAAVPVDGGRAIADPFLRTADAVALLELRAAQLRPAAPVAPAHRRWLRAGLVHARP